ncbi:hypothetical protein DT351_07330 [Latilactobacillus curvatus]|uniref:Phage protein n=1 Tax=Latilactobacillus curvatus TaxID=28038 RepID=A0A385AEW1_LATCU|nr:hypothetical protein [Latilactobacillus curvatus]AXN36190.1 hypothetical protein DT351_07330 [Latilactobacillus curvatus]
MIEVTILDFLSAHLSVPTYTDRQNEMPASYVIFEKTGGSKRNHLLSGTFAFQSYGQSKYEAGMLNEELKRVVEGLITLDVIGGVSLNSDYDFTDTETKEYRYQAVFDINYY